MVLTWEGSSGTYRRPLRPRWANIAEPNEAGERNTVVSEIAPKTTTVTPYEGAETLIIITATLSFETEADRNNAVTLTAPVQRATRDQEPGCMAYCFAADPSEPTHIQVYELWTDPQNLTQHFNHPNYAKMVEVLHNCGGFVNSENRLYAADDRGTVYDDAGNFRFGAVADTGRS